MYLSKKQPEFFPEPGEKALCMLQSEKIPAFAMKAGISVFLRQIAYGY